MEQVDNSEQDIEKALFIHENDKINMYTWLAVSAATSNMTSYWEGLYDTVKIQKPIKVGNKKTIFAINKGKLDVMVCQKNGNQVTVTLKDVLLVPDIVYNLFSISKAWKYNCLTLEGSQKNEFMLRKGDILI